MAIGIKLKHSSGEITTGTGNLQLGAAGNLILDYATFPSADGTNTHVLSTDGAGNLSWVAQSGGSVTLSGLTDTNITTPAANALLQYDGANWIDAVPTTAHITEGANLYYTDARVDTRFASKDTGDLTEGSNLYFTNARADTRIGLANISDLVDVHNAAPTDGQVLKWINSNSRWEPATGSGGIALTDLSVTTASVGTAALAYNNGSGVFTYTPPNLSSYLTSTGALSSHTDVTISGPSSGQHLTYNGSAWVNATVSAASAAGSDTYVQFNDGGNMGADAGLTYAKATDTLTAGTFTTSGASPTLTAAGALAITTTASNGSITITPHGSGDIILDGQKWPQADGTANQILKTNGAGQLSWVADDDTPAGYNNSNWDTAYTHSQVAHAPSGAEANEYSFKTILVSGQSDVVADTTTDALTFVSGSNMTITTSGDTITFVAAGGGGGIALTDLSVTTSSASGTGTLAYNSGTGVFTYRPADLSSYLTSIDLNSLSAAAIDTATDSIAFIDATDNSTKKESIADVLTAIAGTNLTAVGGVLNASGGGGGGTVDYEEFKCNYATDGQLSSMSNLSSGISSVTIDSAAGGDVTVNFTGYTTPPVSIMFYGYGYASNIYIMNTLGSTGTTLRTLPGGGSAGSPTAFGAFASLNIRITEALTGASRSFGTVTHAWIRFVMGA